MFFLGGTCTTQMWNVPFCCWQLKMSSKDLHDFLVPKTIKSTLSKFSIEMFLLCFNINIYIDRVNESAWEQVQK